MIDPKLAKSDFKSLFKWLFILTVISAVILIPVWLLTGSIGVAPKEFILITAMYILLQPFLASLVAMVILFFFGRYKNKDETNDP